MKIIFECDEEKERFSRFINKLLEVVELSDTKSTKQRDLSFDKLWDIYPRKVSKMPSKKKYERLSDKNKELLYSRIQLLNRTEWSGKDKDFIPHLVTFINQERWLDPIESKVEPEVSPKKNIKPIWHDTKKDEDISNSENAGEHIGNIKQMLNIKDI